MHGHETFYDAVNRLGIELVRDIREIEVVVIKRNSNFYNENPEEIQHLK